MAADGDIIKSFLVGLGFDIDESSLRVFNSEIAKAAVRITALYTAVNAFAGGIVYSFSKISEGFEEIGYQYHIIAPAINKAIILRQELLKAYSAAGINLRKAVVDSLRLNLALTKTKYALEAIYKSVASRFFGELTKQTDMFRKRLYANMPYIVSALEKFVKTVFKAFEVVTILGGRVWSILSKVYDFFVMLHKATDGWSTIVLGLIAAWKLLNLSFLATPLGLLLSLGLAVLALYDDFKTWQEGGRSLIDWGSEFTKMIVGLTTIIFGVAAAFGAWTVATKAWAAGVALVEGVLAVLNGELSITALALLAIEAPIWLIVAAIGALVAGLTLADEKWKIFGGGLAGGVASVGNAALNLIGGNGLSSIGTAIKPNTPALGSTPPPGQQNTNANMQTQINILGSPNPSATARATAAEQSSVNGAFVRNLRGATR
jgi:hypothetical protein